MRGSVLLTALYSLIPGAAVAAIGERPHGVAHVGYSPEFNESRYFLQSGQPQ